MEKYFKDSLGQWWCQGKRQREKVSESLCAECGKRFPSRHKSKFCSRKCLGIAQRGFRGGERKCAWCGNAFQPDRRTARRSTCSRRCAYDLGNTKRGRKGPDNPKWKGGVKSHSSGYLREWDKKRGYMLQHRLVMERVLGRPLLQHEQVHHKNGIRDDNRPENLELWAKKQPPGQRSNEQKHCPTCTCCK
jgi:hypothetical protein